ncbi:MAG: N-acetylmuramoyl-L-alanine amidase family protein [Candidatus Kapaibacteriota bacterium]
MMHILIECLLFFSMISFNNLIADEIVCYLPNKSKVSLSARSINQQLYVRLTDITSKLLVGSQYNPVKNTILFKQGNLLLNPQSSSLFFQSSDGVKYKASMTYPVLRQQTEVIVPFDEFTTALNGFGLRSIIKNSDNTYRMGKGIDPAIAATFSLPQQEVIEDVQLESNPSSNDESQIEIGEPIQNSSNRDENSTDQSEIENNSNTITKLEALAYSAAIANKEQCTIIGIDLEMSGQDIVINFSSNLPIEQYQKPELRGRELILRLPNMKNGIVSLKELTKRPQIEAFGHETIRQFLLYTIRCSQEIEYADIKKVNLKSLRLTIRLKKDEIVQKPKQPIGAWDLDVIVLDPGHGGEDAGAISINGYKEKDIALSIAKKVKELLKKELPATKVVMTRDDDTFVELYRRGQIANKQKGKLFISIHCNSMPSKPHPANGCESYILRPGRNSEAVRVAEKENASIRLEKEQINYDDMSEEKLIISTMAQSAFVKFSEKFAAMLQKEVAGKTGLFNRGVNQAGFLVLVGASMPNVLFETGFLSNVNDEKILSSEKGQQSMAEGIVKSIKRYANEYAKNN